MQEQILQELKLINKKLEIIASNFELRDKVAVVERQSDGKRIVKKVRRDLSYLG